MNRLRWLLLGASIVGPALFGACGSSDEQMQDATAVTGSTTVVTSTSLATVNSTVTVNSTGTRTVTRTVSNSGGGGASARHARVQTQGGVVEVDAVGDALRVRLLTPADGWSSTLDDADPTRLVITFASERESQTGTVEIDIRITATGIVTSTSEHLSISSG